jgi:transcriptional regulator with XRE-family HTH domain
MNYSLIFKDLRRKEKLTQNDFANKLNVSRSAIAQIESANNNPSRDLVLRILEVFEVADELRNEINESISGFKAVTKEVENAVDLSENNRKSIYSQHNLHETYFKLIRNKKIILCLCVLLKQNDPNKLTENHRIRLNKIETSISLLTNYVHARKSYLEKAFTVTVSDLDDSNILIQEFTDLVLPHYSNKIRDFKDLFYDKEYEDEDEDNSF